MNLKDPDARRLIKAPAMTITLNNEIVPCKGTDCKISGCPTHTGDVVGWLFSDDFDNLLIRSGDRTTTVHPHVVEELRGEARGLGPAITLTGIQTKLDK